MLKISILKRSTKAAGEVRLRFRIKDGRKCDLTYKSEIVADLRDLAKLDTEGQPRPYISKFDIALKMQIELEREAIRRGYNAAAASNEVVTADLLRLEIERIKYPKKQAQPLTMQTRFEKYIADNLRDGVIGKGRERSYKVAARILYRFLTINKMQDILARDFTAANILDFRDFVLNEYKIVPNYAHLYTECKKIDIPTKPRGENTAANYMRMLKAYFSTLESMEEIEKSPFAKISKEKAQHIKRQRFADPVYLYAEELQKIINTNVPENLQAVRNAFIVQCGFGCRVGDFAKLKMQNVSISPQGFAYIHYLPEKTSHESKNFAEIETPILRYSLEIIKGCGFAFDILRNVTGQAGYNTQIKELLKFCGINRKCAIYSEGAGTNIYVPLHELGSSKLARKTFVDILNKVQINMYAAGLHSEGSEAVQHYTKLELKDRYILMCRAFDQPPYKVDNDLNYC